MMKFISRRVGVALALTAVVGAAACNKGEQPKGEEQKKEVEHGAAEAPRGTGQTILVETYSDANGNYFKPNQITAKKGDIIHFTVVSGVHNVHFLPDSNPGKTGLPAAGDMMQIPGQNYDLPVTFEKGTYYFQCDPHAALGMKGHLKVD